MRTQGDSGQRHEDSGGGRALGSWQDMWGRALPHLAHCGDFGCRWSLVGLWARAPGEGQQTKSRGVSLASGGGGLSKGLTRMVLSVDVVYKAPSECLIPVI